MDGKDALADRQRRPEGGMGVLFLDVDGVLNSPDWFGHWPPKDEVTAGIDVRNLALVADTYLDPLAVQRLNRVAGKAEIVISSSWRYGYTLDEIRWMLERRGFRGTIVGMTPVLRLSRGREIRAWLEQDEVPGRPRPFCVIDDYCRDMDEVEGHTVETTDRSQPHASRVTGLLDEHVEQILIVLANDAH
jgi:hypothetical protein